MGDHTRTDRGRPLTLAEARRVLIDAIESGNVIMGNECDEIDLSSVSEAARQTRSGCLFVVEQLPFDLVPA
jgi:hypothetical protein